MNMWKVETLNGAVNAELATLPDDMLARLRKIGELIQALGLERMREPHVKHLEGRLWEIRLTGRDGIARAIYVTASGKRVVIVRVFVKKTQKTPRHEIELAHRRAKEVI
ncbi:MAG: type II toxin-antitoxin system RelE/ParE family toxin [Alphaproteobacteria bacterium]